MPDSQHQIFEANSRKVFVIADAGCSKHFTKDPDDCMAIEAMLRDPKVRVLGVMSTYGNKDLAKSSRLIRELFPTTPHFLGSASKTAPPNPNHLKVSSLLENHQHVDLIVLSPATDAKHLLLEHPQVFEHLNSVTFVAGRAPKVKFRKNGRRKVKDFNYFQDPASFHRLLPVLSERQILTYFSGYTAGMNVKLPDNYTRSDFISRQQRAWHRKTAFWFGQSLPSFDAVASLVATKHIHRLGCYPVRSRMSSTQLIFEKTSQSTLMFCEGN